MRSPGRSCPPWTALPASWTRTTWLSPTTPVSSRSPAIMGGATTEIGDDHHRRAVRGRALGTAVGRAHGAPAQASVRGLQAVRARRRSRADAGRARARRAAAGPSTAAARSTAGVTDVNTVAPRRHRSHSTSRTRPGSPASPTRRSRSPSLLTELGCTVDRSDGAALTVTPPTWRPDLTEPIELVEEVVRLAGYDDIPERTAAAAARHRSDAGAEAAADRRPGARPRPGSSRCSATRSWRRPSSTCSVWRPTTAPRRPCGWPTRSTTRSRCSPRRCCRRCSRRCAATSAAATGTSRSTRWARCSSRGRTCRPYRWSVLIIVRPTTQLAAIDAASRRSRGTSPRCSPVSCDPAGWWGAGRAASWQDAVEAARDRGGRGRCRAGGTAGRGRAVASGPVRVDLGGGHRHRVRRRAAPGGVPGAGDPGAHRRDGDRPGRHPAGRARRWRMRCRTTRRR